MSKITKRATPLLVLAIITLSMVSIILPVQAVQITGTFDEEMPLTPLTDGDKGDTISVKGTGVTAGVDVNLYWDAVKAWDGEKGLLNSTEAEGDDSFDIWFDVPEAVNGTHYLWVKDTDSGETDSWPFDVYPKTSCPTTGMNNEEVDVKGYGFDDEVKVAVMLITGTTPDGVDVVGEVIDTGDGTETEFNADMDNTPIEPGSMSFTDGVEIFTDNGKGDLVGTMGGDGDIDYVSGDIELEFNTAPANGQAITCDYEYFEDSVDIMYLFTKNVDTDWVGSWKKTVEIPGVATMEFGLYNVYAYDDSGNIDWDDFKIGAGIKLDKDEGPTGTVVEVTGEGFDPLDTIEQGEIFMRNGINTIDCYIIEAPVNVESNGAFKLEIVIPSVPDWDDYDEIQINTQRADLQYDSNEEDFDIVGDAEMEVDPKHGQLGDDIELWLWNFTQIEYEEVTLELWDEDMTIMEANIGDFEVDVNGTFHGFFDLPAVPPATYKLVAYQVDEGIVPYNIDVRVSEGEQWFRVGLFDVILSDDKGPCGTEVSLRGTGFTPNGDWNATMGDVVLFKDEPVDAVGHIIGIFYVPTLDLGTYDVIMTDMETSIEVTAEFEVDNKTFVIFDPIRAPSEYNVSIEGYYFATIEGSDLDFVIYNETGEWIMDVNQFSGGLERDAELNENGNFTAWWIVPELDCGKYSINVTDEEDLFATSTFNVRILASLSEIQSNILNAPEDSVYFVPTGNIYDDSAFYAFYAYTESPQIIASPTQSSASNAYLDEDGGPLFEEDIVTFGGRFANRMVRYFEDQGLALVGYEWNGTHHLFVGIGDDTHIYAVEGSSYDEDEKDYFVFQIYRDRERYIFSEWGICAEGTYAGGLCFIDHIWPNIEIYTKSYYIYSWTDSNNDDMPQPEEITLETSGI